ncbi:MAG: hypothetical protein ABIJ09_06920 [Pseudomonadota bacterium]
MRSFTTLMICIAATASVACQPVLHPEVKEPKPANSADICIAPGAPSNLRIEVQVDGILVSWDSGNGTASGYVVERRLFLDPTWGELVRVAAGETSVLDQNNILLDAQYGYRVLSYRTVESTGNSCLSDPTDEAVATTLPRVPEDAAAHAFADRIELSWRDVNDFETGYLIERRRRHTDRSFLEVMQLGRNDERWTDTDLVAGDTYDYHIFALNRTGRSNAVLVSAPATTSTRVPRPPQLSWSAAPYLDTQCVLQLEAQAVFDTDLGAAYDADRSSFSAPPLTSPAVTSVAEGSDRYALSAANTSLAQGQVLASWEVWDTLEGGATLQRNLLLQRNSVQRARERLPRPQIGDDDGAGRQALIPGCASCQGRRGSLALGWDHVCSLTDQGQAQCWGLNHVGQLGNGVAAWTSNSAVVCSGDVGQPCARTLQNVTALDLGEGSTCAVTEDGEARCWGDNGDGQLGDGFWGEESASVPQTVCQGGQRRNGTCVSLDNVVSLSASSGYACAVTADGGVRCWGDQGDHLGQGYMDDAYNPTPVCSGDVISPCGAVLDQVAEVSVGYGYSCALKQDGSVWCWGYNSSGQTGNGSDDQLSIPQPVCVQGVAAEGTCVPLTGVLALESGNNHSCALVAGGMLLCWGSNSSGQLGDGGDDNRFNPAPVCLTGTFDDETCVPLTGVESFSLGYGYTCAVRTGGELLCWGSNSGDLLGTGLNTGSKNPAGACMGGAWDGTTCTDEFGLVYDRFDSVESVFAGDDHTCAIRTDGSLWCWGDNYWGQLGDGTGVNRESPVEVCLTGSQDSSDCVPLAGVAEVVSDDYATCARLDDTSVWCWGSASYGRLGIGTMSSWYPNPEPVCESGTGGSCVPLTGAVRLGAGWARACARLDDGRLVCWGDSTDGRLGAGNTTDVSNPIDVCLTGETGVDCVPQTDVVGLDMSTTHSCLINADHELLCWGTYSTGNLGTFIANTVPLALPVCAQGASVTCEPMTGALEVFAGSEHACAIVDVLGARQAWCWGDGYYGELGYGDSYDSAWPQPVCLSGLWDGTVCSGSVLEGVEQIALGDDHSCARLTSGDVMCWGYGSLLGDQWGSNSDNPVAVCLGDSSEVSTCEPLTGTLDLVAGSDHSCALLADRTVRCWGSNYPYTTGDGLADTSTRDGAVPVCTRGARQNDACSLEALSSVLQLSAGNRHTCALRDDGTVWCWGSNNRGQLGDGSTEDRRNATQVCGSGTRLGGDCVPLSNVVEVHAGFSHTCAVRRVDVTTTEVICWGEGRNGELGAGPGALAVYPTEVCASGSGNACAPLSGIVSITAGAVHSCALLDTGEVWCWGSGLLGQLGNGDLDENRSASPVPVCARGRQSDGTCEHLQGVVALASAGWNTCALLVSGSMVCWGDNQFGQVGSGLVPVDYRGIAYPLLNPTPVCISGRGISCEPLSNVVSMDIGPSHACALTSAGELWCWGRNDRGQLGDGTWAEAGCNDYIYSSGVTLIPSACRFLPVRVCGEGAGPGCTPLQGVRSVRTGDTHTCAILQDGELRCWGDNRSAQLGDGTSVSSYLPQRVWNQDSSGSLSALTGVVGLSLATSSTCALRQDGTVWCWGLSWYGELGSGTWYGDEGCTDFEDYEAQCQFHPQPVCTSTSSGRCDGQCTATLGQVVAIEGGDHQHCALLEDGQVRCWGDGQDGELGSGNSGWGAWTCVAGSPCSYRDATGCVPVEDRATATCQVLQVTALD